MKDYVTIGYHNTAVRRTEQIMTTMICEMRGCDKKQAQNKYREKVDYQT